MGKKRAKDKSSREEDDIDLTGKEYIITYHNGIWQPVRLRVIFTLCMFMYFLIYLHRSIMQTY